MKRAFVVCITCLTASTVAFADNWPQWRGPHFDGIAQGGGYATEWSPSENVAWKVALPGRGASTPIVWEDKIFLTCGVDGKNTLLCYDRAGKEHWRAAVGNEIAGKHQKASGSNPSAATDGQHVFVYFKSGELACVDFDGKVVWNKNLQKAYGEDTLWWDLGTSPVLTKDLVVVTVMQTGPSYLAGFDKTTGEVVWKHDRNLDAPVEAAQSYTTPLVVSKDGVETIYILGADHVTAHEADSGKEIWRVGGLNPDQNGYFRSISSPTIVGDILIAPYARGSTVTAIKLGGTGDVTKTHVLWTRKGLGADVPTPIAIDGRLYFCSDRGVVSCTNVETGDELWAGPVEKNRKGYSSSPVLADGKLYVTREDGTTFVLELGDKLTVVAANELDESTVATPVFVDGKIYIRTYDHLYCIGS